MSFINKSVVYSQIGLLKQNILSPLLNIYNEHLLTMGSGNQLLNKDINTEKVAKQFDDTNDYFGLVDLWKQIPQSFKDINLTKYLKGFKDDSMFEERGHPSIKGHKEIVELLKDKI